ncbi:MAG: SGNH/GDSL hydrolase family protein [Pyrinomonadaceae bacterium]
MVKLLKKTLLLLIVLLNLQIFAFAQSNYERTNLWEKEIAAFAAADKKESPSKGKVLFVGSSSIRGWRTLREDFPGFYTLNRGFGGSHLEDVNFYAPQIVTPYKPQLIVLYAGENDIVAGKLVEGVYDDYKKFVSIVRKKLPKTRLIFVSLKPSPSRWEFAPKFKELNALIKTHTETDKHLLFVDVWSPMLDADGEPKKNIFQADNLHLNDEGYRIWRKTLLPFIKTGFKGNFR